MITMRQAAVAQLEATAREGLTDTRILAVHVATAQVYALLAIADALEKLAEARS